MLQKLQPFADGQQSVGVIDLTHADVQEIFTSNIFMKQRRAAEHAFGYLADMMANGDFIVPSTLMFARHPNGDGRHHLTLVDGQHRLQAQTMLPEIMDTPPTSMQWVVTVTNMPPDEAYLLMDAKQRPRSASCLSKVLNLDGVNEKPGGIELHMIATADVILRYSKNYDPPQHCFGCPPIRDKVSYVRQHLDTFLAAQNLMQAATGTSRKKLLCTPRVLPIMLCTIEANYEEACKFWIDILLAADEYSINVTDKLTAKIRPKNASSTYWSRVVAAAWNQRKTGKSAPTYDFSGTMDVDGTKLVITN